MRHFGVDERRRRLLARHHLAEPLRSVDDGAVARVAGDLVGLHSSDPATVYLSLHSRIAGFEVGHLEHALYEERELMRILGMRRTLFVAPLALAEVIQASCTNALIANERRRTVQMFEAGGIDDGEAVLRSATAAALRAIEEAAEPIAARTLTPAVAELQRSFTMAAGKKYMAQPAITSRVLLHLSTEGHIVRARPLGSWLSSQYRWAPTERWFGRFADIPADEARGELLRRWLRAFGPGTSTDIAWWTKWTKRVVAVALEDVGAQEVTVEPAPGADSVAAWVLPDDLDDAALSTDGPVVRLLPGLDSTIMGWKQRDWYLGSHAAALFDHNGNAGPVILLDGVAVGAWAQRPDGGVVTEVLEPVSVEAAARIATAARSLTEWLGGVRVTPRFPNPLVRRLALG